ncbi:MAG: tetratricopeptide repeat protein [Endomicrobium sp.]|nr:tetratricopeptide repeat protein [Endomicrobium sp.]
MKNKIKEAVIAVLVCILLFLSGWLLLGRTPEENDMWRYKKEPADSSFLKLYLEAGSYLENKEYENALKSINKIIKAAPKNYTAYYNKAIILFYMGKYKESLKNFDKSIKFSPEPSADIYSGKAMSLLKLKKYEKAIETAKTIFEIEEHYMPAYYLLVDAYIMSGNFQEALVIFEKYINSYPNIFSDDYIRWIDILAKAGPADKEAAEQIKDLLEKAVKIERG